MGVAFPAAAPASYHPGDHVKFDVSSWSMTNALDTKDTEVTVKLGGTTLGTATLNNAAQAALPGFDTTGKASVDVVLPDGTPAGSLTLTLVARRTGTSTTVTVPIIKGGTAGSAPDRTIQYGETAPIPVTVTGTGATRAEPSSCSTVPPRSVRRPSPEAVPRSPFRGSRWSRGRARSPCATWVTARTTRRRAP